MDDSTKPEDEVAPGTPAAESVRAYVEQVLKGFKNQRECGKALGVSQAYISDSLSRKRSGIPKLAEGLAAYLKIPYEQVTGKVAGTTTELDARYPNRIEGARAATHIFPISLDQALAYALRALDAGEEDLPDQTAEWWLEQISAAYKRDKKGVSVGVVVPPSDID